jgi:hypothetical protein
LSMFIFLQLTVKLSISTNSKINLAGFNPDLNFVKLFINGKFS